MPPSNKSHIRRLDDVWTSEHNFFIAMEAKRPTWDSQQTLLTIGHFEEMIRFEEWLVNLEYPVPPANETAAVGEPPTMLTFNDVCERDTTYDKCSTSPRPLDFIFVTESKSYSFENINTDDDLVMKIRTGKGDKEIYTGLGKNIFIEFFFGGTTPRIVEQNYVYGNNDITAAKASRYKMKVGA